MLPVAILCGGKGTRMRESGETLPKPLVEVGGRPILWHVMSLYASQGFWRFELLLGHGADQIEAFATALPTDWEVSCLDTGLDTPTGGRVARGADRLRGGTFCLTYADGVADIDLRALLAFHREHGRAATMTVVRPRCPWGVARVADEGRIAGFVEKPRLENWVNGGFLVMEPRALEAVGPDDVLEREPLEALAAAGELHGFRHEGFWDCMDTYKDTLLLNELWGRGEAPWQAPVEA
jgi:Nucleoside-diphosphate-sugar pyrophosphorylase involved in lipopolysaccharide biosynthesis/translation initiation factor 2B, gamma/epsilon subunits (eIF-2Bgamma/eIF-2Bepsilon)